jgi:hypothetical protein
MGLHKYVMSSLKESSSWGSKNDGMEPSKYKEIHLRLDHIFMYDYE